MTPRAALVFIRKRGIVLESGRGPVPSLVEAFLGEPVRGSWWGHPRGGEIYSLTRAVRESPDILTCRLVGGKVTFIHRRLWPALLRAGSRLGRGRLAAIREEHAAGGAHRVVTVPFPRWASAKARAEAKAMTLQEAIARLHLHLLPLC